MAVTAIYLKDYGKWQKVPKRSNKVVNNSNTTWQRQFSFRKFENTLMRCNRFT